MKLPITMNHTNVLVSEVGVIYIHATDNFEDKFAIHALS